MANMRPVVWLGDSKRNLQDFPKTARSRLGAKLLLIQNGEVPEDVKHFKGLGGVFEIALPYDREAYRVVVAVKLGVKIYVLHTFQKKSKHGIATPKRDRDLIERRYKEAKELAEHEQERPGGD